MSVNTTNKDFWQSTANTIRERCESIFNQELLSDVKFVVRDPQGGSEGQNIPAHKFVLAISSPVFYAMFYGELAETKESVEICDCDYESLLETFRFMYSDEVNLTPDNVMQLMYLAKKYMLPSLADKCSAYLQENSDASSAFYFLSEAQKYEQKELVDHCWKVIERETEEAVKFEGFVTIERSVLEELVEKDSLTIREVELFKAVDRWAEKECGRQGLEAEGSEKRRILGERIIKGVRFPVMKQIEFADVVLSSDILAKKETYNLMRYFSAVPDALLEFSNVARTGNMKVISRFTSLRGGWKYQFYTLNTISASLDKDIKLHAVRLFGSESSEYEVTLTIGDSNAGITVATEKGKYSSECMQSDVLGGYHGFDVVFTSPVALKAFMWYSIEASITGPPSWYGNGGMSSVEHSGVNFTFKVIQTNSYASMIGKSTQYDTNVLRGQFCEFRFTLD